MDVLVANPHLGPGLDPALDPVLVELRELASLRRRLDEREAELLAQVSTSAAVDEHFGQALPVWWAELNQEALPAARTKVRLALRLASVPYTPLRDALLSGRIGWQHVVAFDRACNHRIASDLCELLPNLLDLADVAAFDRWSRELRGIAARLDQDGGYDPARDPANNRLHLTPLVDGVTHVTGTLVGELALIVRSLIETATDEVHARYRRDADELGTPASELPSRAQMAAEALAELLETGASVPGPQRAPLRPDAIAVYDDRSQTVVDRDGATVSESLLRFLLAAGTFHPLRVSGSGDPLHMGRALRFASPHQRRALTIRDGGCVFPGCTAPARWCDAHHVDHWEHGGPTDLDNMALMCRHHHRVTHRPGWSMSRWTDPAPPDPLPFEPAPLDAPVYFQWTTPCGRVLRSQRHHTRRSPDDAPSWTSCHGR